MGEGEQPHRRFRTVAVQGVRLDLDQSDLRRALVGRGYARSRLFSWEATAEATRRIYAEARAER